MNSTKTLLLTIVAMLVAALGIPTCLAAQDDAAQAKKAQHHHYKLIDVGTFGGPQSYDPDKYGQFKMRILENHEVLVGGADTSLPDPFPKFCFSEDCFVVHAFRTGEDGELTDLGALPGGGSSIAQGISRSSLIAGVSENGQTDPLFPGLPESRAVLWHHGEITDLGTLEGGYESIANAVNSKGEVVGAFSNTTPDPDSMFGIGYQTRAFVWQDGVMQDLGTLGGPDAQALMINERGQVVGWSYTSSSPGACGSLDLGLSLATDPFIWEEGKGMTDLGNFGGTCTLATDLNSRGQVVGWSDLAGDIVYRAFLWSKGTMDDLGGSFGGSSSQAFAVNERGEAVGLATLAGDLLLHPALWRGIGKITDLGILPGDQCASGYSINAKSQVVGWSAADCSTPNLRPFLWDDGSIFDLNALIPPGAPLHLDWAQSINDRGEIAGTGMDANGYEHAVLLIPCDDDHPDIEGCDYGMVDASAVATAVTPSPSTKVASPLIQGNPALRGAMNPMLRHFGRRFGPWSWGMGGLVNKNRPVSPETAESADASSSSSNDPAGSSCNNGIEPLAQDRLDGFAPRSDIYGCSSSGCSSQVTGCRVVNFCYRGWLACCWDLKYKRRCLKCLH